MAALSKSEYLKKYMSDADLGGKKKKKKKKEKGISTKKSRVKIVDDDIDLHSLLPNTLNNRLEDDIQVEEDLPVIAAFVDERPDHIQNLEKFRTDKRWKRIVEDAEKSRGERRDSDTSPLRNRYDSSDESDVENGKLLSQARYTRHDSESDQSPVRTKTRHDSESDHSPPRKQLRHDSDSDQSPCRKQKRHDLDSDQSPPRRQKRHDSDSDQSPIRRQNRCDSDSDQSPPRRQKRHDSDSDQSPPRRQKRHDSDSDQSPPRKHKRKSADPDRLSDKRKKKHDPDSDQSPPRKQNRHNSDSDLSPPRRKRKDQSPVRKHLGTGENSPKKRKGKDSVYEQVSPKDQEGSSQSRRRHRDGGTRWSQVEDTDDKGRAKKTLGGAKAGLSSAREMKEESTKLRKKETEAFKKIGDEMLGKNAQTVFRDKSGHRRNIKAEMKEKEEEEAEKAEKGKKYQEWGKGMKQVQEQEQALQDALHEVEKPMARYRDDKDLDAMLREQEREGDPMLAYMQKKKAKEQPGGKKKEIPRYKGPQPPPNRFNIWPGYRWDGVDRSSGFEGSLFQKINEKKARKEEAYKWSTEDM